MILGSHLKAIGTNLIAMNKNQNAHCKFTNVLIELKPSSIHAIGVFAVVNMEAGERVAEGIHEEDYHSLVEWEDLEKCDDDIREKVMAFCVGTPEGFLPPEKLDFNTLSTDWYMNHSCEGNIGIDLQGDFVARRFIRKGEELTYDYGLIESNPTFRMVCNCGSRKCRKIITGKDWKDETFRGEHLEYMLPQLR
jgi:SET domain-containing protein